MYLILRRKKGQRDTCIAFLPKTNYIDKGIYYILNIFDKVESQATILICYIKCMLLTNS